MDEEHSQGISYCLGRPGLLKIFNLGPVLEKDKKIGGMHVLAHPKNSFPPDSHK